MIKLKKAGLCGRSGSGFPTWLKWQAVKQAKADRKYVICNASEGEPGVFKDKHILEHWPEEVINGIKLALKATKASSALIYLNPEYYPKFKPVLTKLIRDLPIELFKKPEGYLCGEETSLLNVIEGKLCEPRIKPPFPTEKGLWNKPTLVNNVETFYWASKINQGFYENKRFFSIAGQVRHLGVFELPENYSISDVLRETNNWPSFEFFVQAGGGASGQVLLSFELEKPVQGLASIIVYNKKKTDALALMQSWAKFFLENNCDKCAPCREGVFRIAQILDKKKTLGPIKDNNDLQALKDIFLVLEKTSLCPLGRISVPPFKTAIEKLL